MTGLVRDYGEPPRLSAAFGWTVLVVLLTWLVLGEYYRLTTPPRPVVVVVPAAPQGPAGAQAPPVPAGLACGA